MFPAWFVRAGEHREVVAVLGLWCGAPEEIRTPDPQIRSPILSNALTFLGFP